MTELPTSLNHAVLRHEVHAKPPAPIKMLNACSCPSLTVLPLFPMPCIRRATPVLGAEA